ncbi:MAG TPA: lysine-sensitive aspartokinase 3 [Thermoanaerobaculia bacterium]|nr:lysine-sensitive aspartokinase 3 [Thermoanaerobaculia bacterium]
MIVIKFGGTSVGSVDALRQAIEIVGAARERKPIVVVSALSGVTNHLVEATELACLGDLPGVQKIVATLRQRHEEIAFALVQQKSDYLESFLAQLGKHIDQIADILKGIALVGDVSPRAKDKIVAIGEKLSSVLFAYTMRLRMLKGVHIDSEDVVVTDANYGEATPDVKKTREAAAKVLLPEIERDHIPVMGGFIGRSTTGATTTLGRGGSDYSAAIIGAAVGAEEIQIWTDVDGMMTCDPRVIKSARVIDEISYVEAAELAYFGAKVLHPKTIWPAVELQIPIRVLNTHNVSSPGTLITATGVAGSSGPRAIAIKKDITVVHITSNQMLGAYGFLAKIFEIFARLQTPVDLITTSEVSVSLTIDRTDRLRELVHELQPFANVNVVDEQAIIALVGRNLMSDASIGKRIFASLENIPVTMISLGSSDLNLSLVMEARLGDVALQQLHRALFELSSEEAA